MTVVYVDWHETKKCRPGSLAIGAGHGVCEVLAANGFQRQIAWVTDGPESQSTARRWVHISEIRQLDGGEFFWEDFCDD